MLRWAAAFAILAGILPAQQLTSAPQGPFHIEQGRLIDSSGRAFLVRGTELPEFRLDTVAGHLRSGDEFGAYSATSLSAIRLRFNLNAVLLPIAPGAGGQFGKRWATTRG